MMGSKARHFAPLINVSVEELVPQDHFYRHLEHTHDLSFVREFVHETYAGGGRPSIDPVVFFKLQLVMFFEGLRSERQLMRHAADRKSKEEVDTVMEQAKKAGATITDEAHDRPWGIYSGYFQDLDGHLWEVVWDPRFETEIID
jgi:catechol 2,3-dioxygenase-like lactoylglutathione lyase family enzyme